MIVSKNRHLSFVNNDPAELTLTLNLSAHFGGMKSLNLAISLI